MIPRTGCQTTEKILYDQNLIISEIRGSRQFWHPSVTELKELGWWKVRDYKFTFVRHPVAWLRSRWAYRKQEGIKPPSESKNIRYIEPAEPLIDSSDNFEQFIENYKEYCSKQGPLVTNFFKEYTEDVTFVGKTEMLRDHLIYVLTKTGTRFNANKITKHSIINQAAKKEEWDKRTKLTKAQIDFIIKIEKEIIDKYNYNYFREEWLK